MRFLSLSILVLFFLPFMVHAQALPTIDFFTVDNNALDYALVERGFATANFSWQASGLRAGDSMMMQAWVNGAWGLIGEGFEPIKTDSLVIAHPLSYELPRYRLSVLNSSEQVVVENILELHYAEPANLPAIGYFLSRSYAFTPESIINEDGVAIHWQVNNRWHRSNIYFEQVFSDGTVIATAENNPDEWRRATDEGILYPDYPGDGRDVVLRLRVVNIDTGETLAQEDTVLPIIRSNVPPAEVIEFSVSPTLGRRGGTATLSWNVSNARRIFIGQRTPHEGTLSMCSHNGGWAADIIYEDLPTSGSLEIQIPEDAYGPMRFQIVADRYLTGQYSCEPNDLLEEIYLELESYTTISPIINHVGMNPSFAAVAGQKVNVTWDINEGQSVRIEQGTGYSGVIEQTFTDLPLAGSMEITISDTVQSRSDGNFWVTFYLVREGVPEPEYLWSDSLTIDPDDNLNCQSYIRTEPPAISPIVAGQEIAVAWDACGLDNVVVRTLMEDPDTNYRIVIDELQTVAALGSQIVTVPQQSGVLRFVLYRILDGQQVELQRASLYIEN